MSAHLKDPLDDDVLDPIYRGIAVRLADEGVPIAAAARALKRSSIAVRNAINDAVASGDIVCKPREDWAPGTTREARKQDDTLNLDDTVLGDLCMQAFRLTGTEARAIVPILKRTSVTKENVHTAINAIRAPGDKECSLKMVDVIVCKIRKKLPEGIEINTVWGRGYSMKAETRVKVSALLKDYADQYNALQRAAALP